MALFIQIENQTILWEMIHKMNILHIVFPKDSQYENPSKIKWFKGHIEKKYAQLSPAISRNDLYKINREVLAGMAEDLQVLATPISSTSIPSYKPAIQETPERSAFSRLQNKPDYENAEVQYKSLFDVPKPKVIDFSEKIEDDVITNMDELIENHKKMREQEMQHFMPTTNKLSILEPIQKEELRPILVEEKRVSFQLPEVHKEHSSDYKDLYQKYENIDTKMNTILDLLSNVLNTLPKDTLPKEYTDIAKVGEMEKLSK